jgi:hypothetical protein
MKNKYLSTEQLHASLSIGKAVEQWLNYTQNEQYNIIRWLRIDKESNGGYTVAYFESFDEGCTAVLDLYAFSSVDPDEPYGILQTFETISEAVNYCITSYHASAENFVAAGMIQHEYELFLIA